MQCDKLNKKLAFEVFFRASRVLVTHNVTWSRKDSFCKEQYATTQPEEYPTSPVNIRIKQIDPPEYDSGFSRFNFEEGMYNG